MEEVPLTQSKPNRSRLRDPASTSSTIKEEVAHHKSGQATRVDSFRNKYFLRMKECTRQRREDT
jgi:hypothetical protein